MKVHHSNNIAWILTGILFLLTAGSQNVYADKLVAVQDQAPTYGLTGNGTEANSPRLSPAYYSTNYEGAPSPYASFMQSPYQQTPGMGNPYGAGSSMMGPPQGNAGQDPLMASEVSPYARYSPYIEVVGEGSNYTLGIDDVVTIIVRNQPDFSGRYVVDPEGNIQYNFVGDVPASGKTKEELKADLVERLKKFVRYPEVAVMISEYRSKNVYVFGYVNRPGKYAMKGDKITIKEAIVAAGLPRVDGAIKRVYVIRPSEFTEDGEPEKTKINLKKMLYQGESAQDFVLQPGDTIVVNQRYFDKFVNNFTRLVGPIFQSASLYELAWGDKKGGFLNS